MNVGAVAAARGGMAWHLHGLALHCMGDHPITPNGSKWEVNGMYVKQRPACSPSGLVWPGLAPTARRHPLVLASPLLCYATRAAPARPAPPARGPGRQAEGAAHPSGAGTSSRCRRPPCQCQCRCPSQCQCQCRWLRRISNGAGGRREGHGRHWHWHWHRPLSLAVPSCHWHSGWFLPRLQAC